MSGNTLSLHSAVQNLPATVLTGKPLGYFANLPFPVETTELSQPQLRQLIVFLLSAPRPDLSTGSFPLWVTENWNALLTDTSGVVRWAAQYLHN